MIAHRTEAAKIATGIAAGDILIAASKRAARIVDRVLPRSRTGRSALSETADFVANARRIGARQELYKALYSRILAKAECRSMERASAVQRRAA